MGRGGQNVEKVFMLFATQERQGVPARWGDPARGIPTPSFGADIPADIRPETSVRCYKSLEKNKHFDTDILSGS